jgi:hypothetical protein
MLLRMKVFMRKVHSARPATSIRVSTHRLRVDSVAFLLGARGPLDPWSYFQVRAVLFEESGFPVHPNFGRQDTVQLGVIRVKYVKYQPHDSDDKAGVIYWRLANGVKTRLNFFSSQSKIHIKLSSSMSGRERRDVQWADVSPVLLKVMVGNSRHCSLLHYDWTLHGSPLSGFCGPCGQN